MRTTQNTVLILAPTDDGHARALATVMRRDFATATLIWDPRGFPDSDSMSFQPTKDGVSCQIRASNGRRIPLESLRSIWWRRVGPYKLDPMVTDPAVRRFCLNECDALFKGALATSTVPIVNRLESEKSANHKPVQLSAAAKVGLRIPKTLMSNNAEQVRAFWESNRRACIYKAFTAPSSRMVETRTLTLEDLGDLERVRHAPVIVQELIEKRTDVRVNIFGERVFAAHVITHHAGAELDWRLDLTATWEQHALPDDVSKQLVKLLRTLGLHYGCIDLRQSPSGEYVFLEVNPSGQFLFVEIATHQPLLHALADLLLAPQASVYPSSVAQVQKNDDLPAV